MPSYLFYSHWNLRMQKLTSELIVFTDECGSSERIEMLFGKESAGA